MPLIPPVKIKLGGNRGAGQSYIKFATAQLSILERQMSFQNLNEGSRVVSPIEGVTVWCISKFGKKEVQIQVDQHVTYPQVTGGRVTQGEKLVTEKPIKETQVYYFVRIKSTDPEPFPRDLYGWIGASYPEIYMDRIILFDLAFNGNVNQVDPDLDNTDNRANGFTPGGGSVAFDVDILNGVVHYPIPNSAEERVSIVNKITTMAADLPTNATYNPPEGLRDIHSDHLNYGRITDPVHASIEGAYNAPVASVTYDLTYEHSASYSSETALWSAFTDPTPEFIEPEVGVSRVLYLGLWRNEWSPLYDGDTTVYTARFDLNNIVSVSDYYGSFLNCPDDVSPYYVTTVGTLIDSHGDPIPVECTYSAPVENISDTAARSLVDGTFFASEIPNQYAPLFMCLFTSKALGKNSCSALVGTNFPYEENNYAWTEYGIYEESTGSAGITNLITPLEDINLIDIMKSSGDINEESNCAEAGSCWLDLAPNLYLFNHGVNPTGGYSDDISVGLPCPNTDPDVARRISKTTHDLDTHRFTTFSIPDPSYPSYNGQSNYAGLFTFIERRESRGQYVSSEYNYSVGMPCFCNGVTFAIEDTPVTPYSSAGVVIYIFAPKVLFDTDTGEFLWDIHTARRDSGIINPYRSLVLEEYVNSAISDIQVFLNNATTIPKLTADGLTAYTLNYYGFGITAGFAKKGSVIVATETTTSEA
jgi:hypothetical protein